MLNNKIIDNEALLMSEITTRLEAIQKRIALARERSPYHQDVTLVAVTNPHRSCQCGKQVRLSSES